jgi:hypothetical protein
MKMIVGPYKGRFFGNLPIMYQKYLLDNIKKLSPTCCEPNNSLVPWLEQHRISIKRSTLIFSAVYIMEQMRIIEGLCGLEFQETSNELIKDSKDGIAKPITGKFVIPRITPK